MLFIKSTAFASALALVTLTAPAIAQKTIVDRQDCSNQDCRTLGDDESSDKARNMRNRNTDSDKPTRRSRNKAKARNSSYSDEEVSDRKSSRRTARSEWRYDKRKHYRRTYRDNRYRHEHNGYWYAEPYWLGGVYVDIDDRLSCREGRRLVDQSFNRVRTIECNGRTYTYLGRRHGETFRVSVNSRTGRIVGVRPT